MRLARGAFIADFGLVFDLSNTKLPKTLLGRADNNLFLGLSTLRKVF